MAATIDDALEILKDTGPEYGGLANHGPMAAETLVVLGRSDRVVPWVEKYKRRLQPEPRGGNSVSAANWREALGDFRRVGDWVRFFDLQLTEAPWPTILNTWVQRLAPGLVAAATHGIIRTGHAVRSLSAEETNSRRHELAEGLAYWAARYQRLPGSPAGTDRGFRPSRAIRAVESLALSQRANAGLIADKLERLDSFPAFANVIDLVDASGSPSAFLSDLTQAFAGLYLSNAELEVIVFIHTVTGPSAIRLMAPHLIPAATEVLLRYAWQAAAGMYAAFIYEHSPRIVQSFESDNADLVDRAVATGDEHAIKFTEACLREYAVSPHPVYLAAAADVARRLRS